MISGRKLNFDVLFFRLHSHLSLFGLQNDCISNCGSNISFIQNDLFICIHKHVNLWFQKNPTNPPTRRNNKNFSLILLPHQLGLKTLVKMIGLVPRKAMRSIIQTDLMILLQKNNFWTSPAEYFEKMKGKIQEMSHHLHKLIYPLVWEFYSLGRELWETVYFLH